MQEVLFVTAVAKEGARQPFIALEPTHLVPVSFAPGLLTLTLRDGVTLEQAEAFAAQFRELVQGVTHVPKPGQRQAE